jgi:hypothetical protein
MTITLIRAIWAAVAALLGIGSFAGGDTSVLCGWLLLAWTFPFGVAWWFYLYDLVQPLLETSVAQVASTVVVIIVAYWFWLVFIPAVVRKSRLSRAKSHNAL